MTARTFGRKGGFAAAAQRRQALVAHQPRSFAPQRPAEDDDAEARRASFLAGESERKAETHGPSLPSAAVEWALRRFKAETPSLAAPTDRSLRIAYPLWLATGLAGGHRFYLRRPITGALQACLFCGCVGAVALQHYEAFVGLALSWSWMLADGLRLKRLFMLAGAR